MTIGTFGKVVLGAAVLMVHLKIFEERGIDGVVLKSIRTEHILTILGIVLIVVGYVLEVSFYNGIDLFECTAANCAAMLIQGAE